MYDNPSLSVELGNLDKWAETIDILLSGHFTVTLLDNYTEEVPDRKAAPLATFVFPVDPLLLRWDRDTLHGWLCNVLGRRGIVATRRTNRAEGTPGLAARGRPRRAGRNRTTTRRFHRRPAVSGRGCFVRTDSGSGASPRSASARRWAIGVMPCLHRSLRQQFEARLEHGKAKLEGLLEDLRAAITRQNVA